MTPPDRLLAVADGPIEVELLPAIGARLHRLRAFGRDLLRSPDDPAEHARDPFRWGAYVMAPWCNRIAAAPTAVGDAIVDLAANFTDGSAIHGQVFVAPWEVEADGSCSIVAGGDGWPWPYRCSLRPSIAGATLTMALSITNLAPGPMPAGLGLHPWFRRPLELRLDTGAVVPSNLDPAAPVIGASGPLDLRALRPVPDDLDATWLAPADPAAELRWPALGIQATLRLMSTAGACLVVASPSAMDAVAVEPQTHAPQGLRRFLDGEPGGMALIAPSETLQLTVELAFAEVGPRRAQARSA